MAYGDFTLDQLIEQFDLTFQESSGLFSSVPGVEASDFLKMTLAEGLDLAVALSTEKARSELVIMPVMLEHKTKV